MNKRKANNKKIELILFDMDGTLVNYPNEPFHASWDVFPEVLSEQKKREWFDIREFYLRKKGFYDEWFDKQLNLIKGISVENVYNAFFPIPYSKGVESFFSSLNGGYVKGIVSSGVGFVAEKIKNDLKFDFQLSSDLEVKFGKFTGNGKMNFDFYEQDKVVADISRECNVKLENVCYIGDHFNDVPAFNIVGLSVAFNPKNKELEKKADYVIYDFMKLNKILKKENKNEHPNIF